MRFLRRSSPAPSAGRPRLEPSHEGGTAEAAQPDGIVFVCTTCGRSDLPEAGDWEPPICLECDAAINEDEIREELDRADDR